ncbi:MAG: hypothetical protein I8H71_11835 [Xanthomonadaceae bacterium]|nr:hypothetical protein [Xanthomonadaceae bacterium]
MTNAPPSRSSRKKGQRESFRFPQGFKLDQPNSRIFLPKLGWMRHRNSRDILDTAKNITISQIGGKWFASIQTERELEQPVPTAMWRRTSSNCPC